jgi:ribosomal protein L17
MKLPACVLIALFAVAGATSPTPTATPDLTNVTEADILSTIAHRNALHEQLVDQVLPSASTDIKEAVAKAQTLQKEIDRLALQAARVPVLEAEIAKAHKACWRNLMIGAISGAVLVLVGPTLIKLAGSFGV